MTKEEKTKQLMLAVRELSIMVDDYESFMEELTDVMDIVKKNGNLAYLERFIDSWETRTVSSNDVSLGGVIYDDTQG
jgi:hypothetical protein